MNPLKRFQTVLYTLCLALTGFSVNAAVVSYSDTFSTYTSTSGSTTGSYTSASASTNDAVNLQGFDSSLGVLTGVDISFTSSWDFSAQVQATDSQYEYSTYYYTCGSWWSGYRTCSSTYSYNDTWGSLTTNSDLTVSLVDPAGSSSSLSFSLSSYCSSNSTYATCSDIDNTGTMSFDGTLDLSSLNVDDFVKSAGDTVDLDFINLKSFSLNCDYNDSGDTCFGNGFGNWSGTVTIAYTYDSVSVPEPGTVILLGAGLIGLYGVRKAKPYKQDC